MHIFPAGAAPVAPAGSIAADTVADAVDAAELFDVDMDQFAGSRLSRMILGRESAGAIRGGAWPRRRSRQGNAADSL